MQSLHFVHRAQVSTTIFIRGNEDQLHLNELLEYLKKVIGCIKMEYLLLPITYLLVPEGGCQNLAVILYLGLQHLESHFNRY